MAGAGMLLVFNRLGPGKRAISDGGRVLLFFPLPITDSQYRIASD